jgi:hypothetical protein
MKAIIFLASRSRYHIPRVGGFVHAPQFAALTYPNQPIVLEGRALDMDEFNKAATRLLDRRPQNLGYDVSVRLVDEAKLEEMNKPAPQPVVQQTPEPEAPAVPASSKFRLEGKSIYVGDERIGGLFGEDKQLRIVAAHQDLRQEVESWLAGNQDDQPAEETAPEPAPGEADTQPEPVEELPL